MEGQPPGCSSPPSFPALPWCRHNLTHPLSTPMAAALLWGAPLSSALKVCQLFTFPPVCYDLIENLCAGQEGTQEAVFSLLTWLTECISARNVDCSRFIGDGMLLFSAALQQESCLCQSALQWANGRKRPQDPKSFLTHISCKCEPLCAQTGGKVTLEQTKIFNNQRIPQSLRSTLSITEMFLKYSNSIINSPVLSTENSTK